MDDKKKFDAIIAPSLTELLRALNHVNIDNTDVISIFENSKKEYVATFYN